MEEIDQAAIEQLLETASEEDLDKILAQLQLVEDFPTYSDSILKVQTPQAKIVKFALNGPQKILHKIIEEHIKPHRLVRIVALKARRMGFSTYFSGRFYRGADSCRRHTARTIRVRQRKSSPGHTLPGSHRARTESRPTHAQLLCLSRYQ